MSKTAASFLLELFTDPNYAGWTSRLSENEKSIEFYNNKKELIYSFTAECSIHRLDRKYASIAPSPSWFPVKLDEN
jgi:hypothetical protein